MSAVPSTPGEPRHEQGSNRRSSKKSQGLGQAGGRQGDRRCQVAVRRQGRQDQERCRRSQGCAEAINAAARSGERGQYIAPIAWTSTCAANAVNQGKSTMTKAMILASAAMVSLALLSGGAGAQGMPQTIEKVNVQKLAAGYRASKIIGSSVVNNANDTIGKIDDLLVSPDGKQPYAVLSIDPGF